MSGEGEQPPSPTTTNTATAQESRRPSSENHTPAVAEPNQISSSSSSEHSSDTVNGEHEGNDRQGIESSSEEHMGSSKEPLGDYGWEELEQRFTARMEECRKNEELLGQEFNEWLKVRLMQRVMEPSLDLACTVISLNSLGGPPKC